MKARLTNQPAPSKLDKILEEADRKEAEEDIILEEIRKSGKPKIVDEETYYENTYETNCRYCMYYNDETDGCNKGISDSQWIEMHDNREDCELYEYVYTLE